MYQVWYRYPGEHPPVKAMSMYCDACLEEAKQKCATFNAHPSNLTQKVEYYFEPDDPKEAEQYVEYQVWNAPSMEKPVCLYHSISCKEEALKIALNLTLEHSNGNYVVVPVPKKIAATPAEKSKEEPLYQIWYQPTKQGLSPWRAIVPGAAGEYPREEAEGIRDYFNSFPDSHGKYYLYLAPPKEQSSPEEKVEKEEPLYQVWWRANDREDDKLSQEAPDKYTRECAEAWVRELSRKYKYLKYSIKPVNPSPPSEEEAHPIVEMEEKEETPSPFYLAATAYHTDEFRSFAVLDSQGIHYGLFINGVFLPSQETIPVPLMRFLVHEWDNQQKEV